MNKIELAAALLLVGCGGGGSNGNTTTGVDASLGTHDGSNQQQIDAPPGTSQLTVFTIVLENHDYNEIIGSSDAPYINSLLAQGALATAYKDTGHPSLPNYLHMISGDNQYPGFIDLDPTNFPFPKSADNLATQLEAANIPWRSYQESMGTPCKLSGSGNYAPKHDPFLYFTDQQSNTTQCNDTNVDYSSFAADLAANHYRYMWITPNLVSDGHNPTSDPVQGLQACDAWMATEVPKILASDAYKQGGVLFITWDEAEGRTGDPDKIPMVILSPKLKHTGMTSGSQYDHSSYLATVEDLFGLPRLATVTSTPNLMEFLNP